jgi:hypothetical protein
MTGYQQRMSYSEQLADFSIIVPLQMVQRGSEIPCTSQQSWYCGCWTQQQTGKGTTKKPITIWKMVNETNLWVAGSRENAYWWIPEHWLVDDPGRQGRPMPMGQPGQSEHLAPPPPPIHRNFQKKCDALQYCDSNEFIELTVDLSRVLISKAATNNICSNKHKA